jgi:MYXO-CTERM domain-containing protein
MVCTSPYSSGIVLDSKGGDPRAPAQGGTGTGSTGGTGAGGGPGGAVPPSTPSPTHETAGNTSPPNAGCAVAGGSSPGAFLALALLGLVLARRRR